MDMLQLGDAAALCGEACVIRQGSENIGLSKGQ